MAMRTLWILVVAAVISSTTCAWPPDTDCLLRDGTVGHCTAPINCKSSYHTRQPVQCRYSRGYDLQICCPRTRRLSYTDPDDFYSDDQPISFPSEPTFGDYSSPSIPSYNRPMFGENPQPFRPKPTPSRPQYFENPGYVSKPLYSYNVRPSSVYEYQETSRPSNEYENRPNSYRPVPADWQFPKEEYKPDRRTTPKPTWAVEDNSRETQVNSKKRISMQKCEEYSRPVTESINVLPLSIDAEAIPLKVEKCDFKAVSLIVGGQTSEAGEFPHMAAIGFRQSGSQNVMWNCGGTLISDRYIMTAGHCVNTSFGNPVVVRLGELNLVRNDDGADPVDYGIERIVVHPNYFKSLKYNDIALLRLSRNVRFNKLVRPACLPSDSAIRGKPVATGWGRTDFVGKLSDILMKVSLSIVDNNQCNSFYSTNNPGSSSFSSGIVDSMICAGELAGGRDTCLGDSGGPLTITKKENPCVHYVVGITSFGKICAAPESPGVYTRVSKFLNWIERTVWS